MTCELNDEVALRLKKEQVETWSDSQVHIRISTGPHQNLTYTIIFMSCVQEIICSSLKLKNCNMFINICL